ncbi:hypothetical protein JXA31_09360 [Candidatus Bathyarchaeota archaeon]|nr:hypothetical protein [Candidatus Bathyarchaeota archaeon]
MGVKKNLEKQIRGWFPKEPALPSTQSMKMAAQKENEKQNEAKIKQVLYVILGVGGVLLGIFSGMGYGLCAAIVIGVATALVIAVADRHLNPRQRGAKEVRTVVQRKVMNSILIFNVAIFGLYLALYFGILPIISNAELALVIVIALLAVWFLVNRLLLRNLRKQATPSMEEKL